MVAEQVLARPGIFPASCYGVVDFPISNTMERKRSTAPLFRPQGHFSGLATQQAGFITQNNTFMNYCGRRHVFTTLVRRHVLLRAIFGSLIFAYICAVHLYYNYVARMEGDNPTPHGGPLSFTPAASSTGYAPPPSAEKSDSPPSSKDGWEPTEVAPRIQHKQPPPETPGFSSSKDGTSHRPQA